MWDAEAQRAVVHSPALSTTSAQSGACWATLNNHHTDNAGNWNIHEPQMYEQLLSFLGCTFWVQLVGVLFLCWRWLTAGALSPQLLSVACGPSTRKTINPNVTQCLRAAQRHAWLGLFCHCFRHSCCFYSFDDVIWWRLSNILQHVSHITMEKLLHGPLPFNLYSSQRMKVKQITQDTCLICSVHCITHSVSCIQSVLWGKHCDKLTS